MLLYMLLLGVFMIVLSGMFWCAEYNIFDSAVKDVMESKRNSISKTFAMLACLPKLTSLILDVACTLLLATYLGMSNGVMGAILSITLSNVISYYIVKKSGLTMSAVFSIFKRRKIING